jgi:hypothetical protein
VSVHGFARMNEELVERPIFPPEYRMSQFPADIDFLIPGFEESYPLGYSRTLAVAEIDCRAWFHEFVDRIVAGIGKSYLPIMRLSDGEFLFILGEVSPDFRLPWRRKLRQHLSQWRGRLLSGGRINTFTQGHYQSGVYSRREWGEARSRQADLVRWIAVRGILAWHLNYVRDPFAERYFPHLDRWLVENRIPVTRDNYYPFYFVYASLVGPRRGEIFAGRRVLVVNGATGERRAQIEAGLRREGVLELHWCQISENRSLFDTVDVRHLAGRVDLALVGAGIGKAGIMQQLEPLGVPCIDAGFVFQVWLDPRNRFERVFCATDADWREIGSSPFRHRIA